MSKWVKPIYYNLGVIYGVAVIGVRKPFVEATRVDLTSLVTGDTTGVTVVVATGVTTGETTGVISTGGVNNGDATGVGTTVAVTIVFSTKGNPHGAQVPL